MRDRDDERRQKDNISRRSFLGGAAAAAVFPVVASRAGAGDRPTEEMDLSGRWRFRLDPEDEGVDERWFARELPHRIRLPGSLQEQGYGNDVTTGTNWLARGFGKGMWYDHPMYEPYRQPDNIRVPFVLQPKKHYVGPAWYQRRIAVPEGWAGRRITLTLERPHWQTTAWVDGRRVGSNDSLAVPHRYDLTDHLSPGTHRLTLRIDNSMIVGVGINAHSVSDQTQSAWNGVVGRLALTATDPVWIGDVQVYPDVAGRRARVRLALHNRTGRAADVSLALRAEARNTRATHAVGPRSRNVTVEGRRKEVELDLPMGEDVLLWDEFDPALYRLTVRMEARAGDRSCRDSRRVTFGMREFGTDGTRFRVNGRTAYLRGNLECCIFPRTGYPAMDVESWRRIMRRAKAHGLNHLRFHSWCPPEACFRAADEEGIYLQPEVDEWTHVKGEKKHDFFLRESLRMLREYGNHPSFTMMALGNEGYCTPEIMRDLLEHWRKDPRRVYTGKSNSNGSVIDLYQFCVARRWGGETLRHKTSDGGLKPTADFDYRAAVEKYPKPFLVHETVQRCSYPDPAWAKKYTGALRPGYLDIACDQLDKHGMADQAPDFVRASGRWQVRQFKEEIEADLRTDGLGGFQLLQLHDFPGQGSALVGVLDAFWDGKGYLEPAEFRRFCGRTVPLARLEKFTWTTADRLEAGVEISHFGPEPLTGATVRCRIVDDDGAEQFSTEFGPRDIPTGALTEVGRIEKSLDDLDAPAKYRLIVDVPGTEIANDWPVWVYPRRLKVREPGEVQIARNAEDALGHLRRGGRVLLLPPAESLRGRFPGPFRSIFWTSATLDRPFGSGGHTMGFLCDPEHPVFRSFPTDFHTDWQWYELLDDAQPMVLDGWGAEHPWPKDYRPTIQMIDCWKYNRKLAVLAEARVGPGRLAICGMDVESDLEDRFVARQFRHSLLAYLNSDAFAPQQPVGPEQVEGLFKELSVLQKLGATATADSHEPGHPPANAIDNRPGTIWHTRWSPEPDPMPHHLTVDLKAPRKVTGLRYVPRDDMANGRVARYEVRVSTDGREWSDPAATGRWPNNASEKTVRFDRPVEARYVRLVALSEVNGKAFASAAEVAPLLADSEKPD